MSYEPADVTLPVAKRDLCFLDRRTISRRTVPAPIARRRRLPGELLLDPDRRTRSASSGCSRSITLPMPQSGACVTVRGPSGSPTGCAPRVTRYNCGDLNPRRDQGLHQIKDTVRAVFLCLNKLGALHPLRLAYRRATINEWRRGMARRPSPQTSRISRRKSSARVGSIVKRSRLDDGERFRRSHKHGRLIMRLQQAGRVARPLRLYRRKSATSPRVARRLRRFSARARE